MKAGALKRSLLRACMSALAWAVCGLLPHAGAFTFEPGEAVALYVPRAAGAELRDASEDLARVLTRITGARVEARAEPLWGRPEGMFLGDTRAARRWLEAHPEAQAHLQALGGTGLWVVEGGRVLCIAGRASAAIAGAYRFLHERAGARWYLPGPLGEVLPQRPGWQLEPGLTVLEPAYVTRHLTQLPRDPQEQLWARRNALTPPIPHNHNLRTILREAAEIPRAWGPLIGGERVPLSPANSDALQPNLLDADFTAHVIAVARRWLDRHPRRSAFALGLSDSLAFGAYPGHPLDPVERWHGGWPDYSGIVYTFYNAVARALAESHPERSIGTLAYYPYDAVPPFAVEPNLIPHLCADRSQYFDPDFRAADLALIRAWGQSGARHLALRSYVYGAGYTVPRLFLGYEQEALQVAHAAGFRHYFAELNPIWGFDALKAWAMGQLLWDPQQDLAALLREACVALYGPAAAEHVLDWHRRAEAAWAAQPGSARWIQYYYDAHQSLVLQAPPLDLPQGLVEGLEPRQRARLALLQDALRAGPDRPARHPLNARLNATYSALKTPRPLPDPPRALDLGASALPALAVTPGAGWRARSFRSEGFFYGAGREQATGAAVLLARNSRFLELETFLRVDEPSPEAFAYALSLELQGRVLPNDAVVLQVQWHNAEGVALDRRGEAVGTLRPSPSVRLLEEAGAGFLRVPPGTYADWQAFEAAFEAPPGAARARVRLRVYVPETEVVLKNVALRPGVAAPGLKSVAP